MVTRTTTPIRDHALHRPIWICRARRFYGDSQDVVVPRRIRNINPRVIKNINVVNILHGIINNEYLNPFSSMMNYHHLKMLLLI